MKKTNTGGGGRRLLPRQFILVGVTKTPISDSFGLWSLYQFIIHFRVNLTSERTSGDFTDYIDFWQVEAKTVFFACAIFVGE